MPRLKKREDQILKAQMPRCGFERLPWAVIQEILCKLDLESICAVTPTCRLLSSCASQVLSSFEAIDLSEHSPDNKVLSYLLRNNKSVRRLTVNCRLLDDSSLNFFALSRLQELVLHKCSSFSYRLFVALGHHCTNLRLLSLELVCDDDTETPESYKISLKKMLEGCLLLESLCVKLEGPQFDPHIFEATAVCLPATVKVLNLQRITEKYAKQLAYKWGVHRIAAAPEQSGKIPFSLGVSFQGIQSLSLVLDRITDGLLTSITQNLFLLVKLELRDEPMEEPLLHYDLTNGGMQSLGSCNQLSHLSLIRSRGNYPAYFRRVNDMGMFLMVEGCKNMESIKLGGFCRVTDAGFSAILHTCKNLKTFELYNTFHLSDLAFHDLVASSLSLVSVRLISCNLITSESVEHLAFCENLELLDLKGCKSVADDGMRAISRLKNLSTLSLNGADITDIGVTILGGGDAPLVSLSLRGCKRVTDRGIAHLLVGHLKKTLTALDLGYMPAISDKAIVALTEGGLGLVELCIRNCFSVTDTSIAALASRAHDGVFGRSLRRLDLYNCIGLSSISLQWLRKPYFPRLRWLGLGSTSLSTKLSSKELDALSEERLSLSICWSGCEAGCLDRWPLHEHL